MQKYLCLFILTIAPFVVCGQKQVLDNNPPAMDWRQINTPGFRVIFPHGYSKEAQRVANTLEHVRMAETESMGEDAPRKISLILQNQNSVSNGFVTLGPRRSEFYTMPPQDYNFIGTNRWLDLLAVHEYRHIVQFQQSKTGWNKFFYYLFGENTQAGMAFSAAPPWFWEGDATAIETSFTHSGRGRIPSFNRVFRANLLEGKRFNYHKQHLRSYKDYIPNHYVLGYHFVTHLRRRTNDPDIWGKVSNSAFSWPFIPFTFSNALKRHTGTYLVKNYDMMMNELDSVWTKQLQGLETTRFEPVNERRSKAFTDYSFPQILDNGKLVALKSGIGDIQQFVYIGADGEDEKVFVPGIMNESGMLSSAKNKVVWNEIHFDPRWRVRTYSVIKAFDFETEKLKVITHKTRYGGAAISPDAGRIVTVLTTEDQNTYLVILDYDTGQEIKRFDNPENAFYSMARWSDDGERIVALKTTEAGRSVVAFNVNSGAEQTLVPASYENKGHPVLYKNMLFYNSPLSGIDNIYMYDLESGEYYQVTSSKYGAYNPEISNAGDFVYYNDHTVNGLDVVRIPLDKSGWRLLTAVEDRSVKYYQPVVEQEGHEDILNSVPATEYPEKKYSRLGHIINLHSWGPYASTDLNSAQFGVFSQDVLSTTAISLGYQYDAVEETGFGYVNVSYQGFYPIIDLQVSKGSRSTEEAVTNENNQVEDVTFNWDETSVDVGLRLPLLLTRSKYHRELSLENEVGITKVENFNQNFRFLDQQSDGDLYTNVATVNYFNLLKQSIRDINSKWGQSFAGSYTSSPFGGDYDAGQLALRGTLYFPGLFKHHSFYLRGAYQHKSWKLDTLNNDTYLLSNQIPLPRGYSHSTWEDFFAASANYTLPLWYPDIALGPLLNLKRIRTNLFYDYGYSEIDLVNQAQRVRLQREDTYHSVGADVLFDVNFLRFPADIALGFRFSYAEPNNFKSGGSKFEFLISNISF
ncbi:hypothetical protein GCM10009122_41740 [Fulvivirga kasyanovii]|uniref:Uncharacterized protein n=1 Tax=Fulvivirga kasyanovii TaxID=396812 RepID=A0ABW9RTM6_9BACT|nr:hypothetical protein [Fulvivirga kasyanovii]MTI26644.1 hypothetical protein [Fulvivirga kasyanovii]